MYPKKKNPGKHNKEDLRLYSGFQIAALTNFVFVGHMKRAIFRFVLYLRTASGSAENEKGTVEVYKQHFNAGIKHEKLS